MIVYHGTAKRNLESIMRRGIEPERSTVYTTSSKERADAYARLNTRHDEKSVTLKIEIPKEREHELVDTHSQGHIIYSLAGNIPPAWIKDIEEHAAKSSSGTHSLDLEKIQERRSLRGGSDENRVPAGSPDGGQWAKG